MKFRIRYADQIVGLLVIIALAALVTLVFLIGSRQRWFSRDYQYKTYAAAASGLAENMAVLFKGIQIGSVKNFRLTDDDRIEVNFTIYDQYNNRVRRGSLVQIVENPLGLGNKFVFYPGLGQDILEEFSLIPTDNSPEGRELIAGGLGYIPSQDDTIAMLLSKVNGILDGVQTTLDEVNSALRGNEESVLGRTLNDVEKTVHLMPGELEELLGRVNRIAADISVVSAQLKDPGGVASLLDGDGALITGLESSITSVSGILSNLEKTTAYLPQELPRILAQVETTLREVEDILVALSNNPLLKKGIPEHPAIDSSGTNPRDISF